MADSNNSHGNVKGFLQYLETIWAHSLNKVRQLCPRTKQPLLKLSTHLSLMPKLVHVELN